jgi:cytochrome P450
MGNEQRRGQMRSIVRQGLPPGLRLPAAAQTFAFWKWPLSYLERCRRYYGNRFTLHATNYPPLVFLSDPRDIKKIITAPANVLHPGKGAGTIEPLVGEKSFMLSEEDEHLAGRRAILPAFHGKVVHQHTSFVTDAVRRAVASWPRDTTFALHPRLRVLTLEVLLSTVFGISPNAPDDRLYTLRDRLLAMLEVTASIVLSEPLLRHGPGRRIWERFLRQRAEVDRLIFALIEEPRRAPEGSKDALTMLLDVDNADGSPISIQQVRDNLMSLVLAGHETTASELAWAFQLLAHNPRVRDRLIDEIDRDAGEEYLVATIQEVLRHRPVFLFTIPRAVMQPIEIGGWRYGPPTQLLGCIYLVHHDPELYPDPHEFRPERFLEASPSTYTWLPWGGGRKRCPGLHLATLEMKIVLRTVLASMTVRPAARKMEHPRWRSVIVTPHAGSRVVLHRRR